MGFLKNDDKQSKPKDQDYLDLEQPKTGRPAMKEPHQVWVHKIPSIETTSANGMKVTVRRYRTEICTSTSRNGGGCRCCSTTDPLWDRLDEKTKYNRKGVRVDFPKTPINILIVLERGPELLRILKGGNQVYEGMDAWYGMQPTDRDKDLRRCDWQFSKAGKGLTTKYTTARLDPTPYIFSTEQEEKTKALLAKAIQDIMPGPVEEFMTFIKGEDADQSQQAMSSVASPFQTTVAQFNNTIAAPTAPATVVVPVQMPVQAQPAPVQQVTAPVAPTQATAPANNKLAEFSAWINSNKEFQGRGLLDNLVPWIRELNNGDITYHNLPAARLDELRSLLEVKLSMLRSNG